jgi:hypothetical protein
MRQIQVPAGSYTYDPVAKTVTVSGVTFTTEQVLLVENVTRGAQLYRPLDATLSLLTPVAANVITLNPAVVTTGHAAGDKLRIVLAQLDPSARDVSTQVQAGDVGQVVNSVIHGRSTAGGGSFVDVKVNPSGTLPVDADGSVIALDSATKADLLAGVDSESGKTLVGNMNEKFRETFNTKDAANWDFTEDASDLVFIDGNSASESYAVFSKSALAVDNSSSWLSKQAFKVPYKFMLGMSLSQRIGGEEHAVEMVGVDENGNVLSSAAASSVAISGQVAVASNVATVNFAVPHALFQGAQVVLSGNEYTPLNVGPVIATVVSRTQITVPCTAANGTYNAGGTATYKNPCGLATHHVGIRWQGATSGNADVVSSNGSTPRVVGWNPGNTQDAAVLPNEGGLDYSGKNFTRAFRSKGTWHMEHQTDVLGWQAYDSDAVGALRSQNSRDNANPIGYEMKVRLRSDSFANKSRPVARITSVSKSGSTTATVTTDVPHNLVAGSSFVQIYGNRDQTNFANLATATAVASVVSPTQFTIAYGASFTGSSYGGYVMLVNGNSAPSQSAVAAQTYAKTSDNLRLSLVGNANWAQTVGQTVTPYGFVNSSNAVIPEITGRWRVAVQSTTTLELEPLEGQDVSALPASATNCGGGIVLNTDFRLNRFTLLDRFAVKVDSSSASGVASRSHPVKITEGVNVSQVNGLSWSRATLQSGGAAPAIAFGAPASNTDVASAARTATGNSGTIADDLAGTVSMLLDVTAVSGTSPTLDVFMSESYNNGVTWVPVWYFPRVTANATLRCPALPSGGRRRIDWVIGGTSPSFTFSVTTMRGSQTANVQRQYFDRTANVLSGTLNAVTPWFDIAGLKSFNFRFTAGAITTTAAQYQVELSDDQSNAVASGSAVSAVASSTVSIPPASGAVAGYARLRCTSAGSGQTGTHVSLYGTN